MQLADGRGQRLRIPARTGQPLPRLEYGASFSVGRLVMTGRAAAMMLSSSRAQPACSPRRLISDASEAASTSG